MGQSRATLPLLPLLFLIVIVVLNLLVFFRLLILPRSSRPVPPVRPTQLLTLQYCSLIISAFPWAPGAFQRCTCSEAHPALSFDKIQEPCHPPKFVSSCLAQAIRAQACFRRGLASHFPPLLPYRWWRATPAVLVPAAAGLWEGPCVAPDCPGFACSDGSSAVRCWCHLVGCPRRLRRVFAFAFLGDCFVCIDRLPGCPHCGGAGAYLLWLVSRRIGRSLTHWGVVCLLVLTVWRFTSTPLLLANALVCFQEENARLRGSLSQASLFGHACGAATVSALHQPTACPGSIPGRSTVTQVAAPSCGVALLARPRALLGWFAVVLPGTPPPLLICASACSRRWAAGVVAATSGVPAPSSSRELR